MKNGEPPRSRNARLQEIDSRLRSAGDYLGLMMQHETEASASVTGPTQDVERHAEAHRKFARDYHAFLSAAAVAWNYMIQAAEAAGTKTWLDARFSSNLFQFHRALENQAKHDYEVVVGLNQKMRYEAEPGTPMIRSAAGVMPARGTITGFEGMTFHHKPGNLEPDVAPLCESVLKKYPNETVVQLACRFLDGLRRTFNTGERAGKFGTEPPPEQGGSPRRFLSRAWKGKRECWAALHQHARKFLYASLAGPCRPEILFARKMNVSRLLVHCALTYGIAC